MDSSCTGKGLDQISAKFIPHKGYQAVEKTVQGSDGVIITEGIYDMCSYGAQWYGLMMFL